MAQRVGASGAVVAVEAQSENFALLVDNLALNRLTERVVPVRAAVSARDRAYSLTSQGKNSGATRLVRQNVLRWLNRTSGVGIDEIVSTTFEPDLIKLDIEGLELAVLEESSSRT